MQVDRKLGMLLLAVYLIVTGLTQVAGLHFAYENVVVGGLGPALIAQCVASILQDIHSGKPAWRIRFNAGQLTLSLVAAWAAMRGHRYVGEAPADPADVGGGDGRAVRYRIRLGGAPG